MKRAAANVLWLAAMAGLAFLAIGVELDREARRGDLSVEMVPSPFRAFAEERIATQAVRTGSPDFALASARRLVAVRPVPAENLMLLGLAEIRAGEAERGTLAIQMAARRGWRDVGAQKVMFGLALDAGDVEEAANRLAALWVPSSAEETAVAGTRALLATEAGRAAFAQRLVTGGYWIKAPLRRAADFDPESFSRAIELANRGGAQLDCRLLAQIARNYRQQGNAEASRRIWSGACANGRALDDAL